MVGGKPSFHRRSAHSVAVRLLLGCCWLLRSQRVAGHRSSRCGSYAGERPHSFFHPRASFRRSGLAEGQKCRSGETTAVKFQRPHSSPCGHGARRLPATGVADGVGELAGLRLRLRPAMPPAAALQPRKKRLVGSRLPRAKAGSCIRPRPDPPAKDLLAGRRLLRGS